MFKLSDVEVDEILSQGLREVPVPDVSAAFDSSVRAALEDRRPAWLGWWQAVRPAFAPAGIALAVTLAGLIIGASQVQPPAQARRASGAGSIALGVRSSRARSIERELNRLDRDTPTLGGVRAEERPAQPRRRPDGHGTTERGIAPASAQG